VSGVPNGLTVSTPASEHSLRRPFAELGFAIASKELALAAAVATVRRTMEMLALDNDWISRSELCLQEALLNALCHGNRRDPSREIHVRCIFSAVKVELHVEDDGTGYESNRDFSGVRGTSPGGRGLFLIHQLMDSVAINRTGNHIVMSLTKESSHGNQRYAG